MSDLKGRIALVTGANSGIGKETARGLASRGATVVMAVRNMTKGRAAMDELVASTGGSFELLELDLASLESVRRAVEQFHSRHEHLHLLVNNAGLVSSERATTEDGFELTMGVNHLGPFLLTQLLLETLTASASASAPARIINVASMGHRFSFGFDPDDLFYDRRRFNGVRAYCDSKLANILFTRELARRLEGSGVVVHALHPGVVHTNLGGTGAPRWAKKLWDSAANRLAGRVPFLLNAEQGALTSLHVATSPQAAQTSGEYWRSSKVVKAKLPANETSASKALWEASERLLKAA